LDLKHPILLFDGVCNLCGGWVRFILRWDKRGRFRFAALQSKAAQRLLRARGLPAGAANTVVLLEAGETYTRSAAGLRVLRGLGGFWALGYGLILVPRFIRDGAYDWIARNRYRIFGRKDRCLVPRPEWKTRFLK